MGAENQLDREQGLLLSCQLYREQGTKTRTYAAQDCQ